MRLALQVGAPSCWCAPCATTSPTSRITLPTLLGRGSAASIHFWFAGFDGLRAPLFPSLVDAYQAWCAGDAGRALQRHTGRGALHFTRLAEQVLALHAQHAEAAETHIETLLSSSQAVCRG